MGISNSSSGRYSLLPAPWGYRDSKDGISVDGNNLFKGTGNSCLGCRVRILIN